MMIYDQLCLRHHEAGHLSSLKLEGLQMKVWSVNQDYSRLHTHNEIYQTCKYNYSEEIAYRTEPEIGNSIHKTTGENR